ncbi:hypothetical protein [Sphaerochaeta globosa]|nr:hypothetical protein [Sphaerochaeta globosa]
MQELTSQSMLETGGQNMTDEKRLDAVNETIGEVATEIAQAYAEYGDLTSMYLGQTSSTLQLRLFRPLALETSLYMSFLLVDSNKSLAEQVLEDTEAYAVELGKQEHTFVNEGLLAYTKSSDKLTHFIERCQGVVAGDAVWLSTQRQDTQPQISISDKGYVAIHKGAERLEKLATLL